MAEGNDEVRVLVTLLRRLRGWNQAEMASRSGVHKSSLSSFEQGRSAPSRAALEKMAAAACVPMWAVDGALSPLIAFARQLALGAAPAASSAAPSAGEPAGGRPLAAADGIARALYFAAERPESRQPHGSTPAGGRPRPAAGGSEHSAGDPWLLLPAAVRGEALIAGALSADFAGLVERLCAESETAAAPDARRALALARLARQLAELAPGESAWRCGLQSKAWAFEARALRAGSEPHAAHAADAALAAARALRHLAGIQAEGILSESRFREIERRSGEGGGRVRRDRREGAGRQADGGTRRAAAPKPRRPPGRDSKD
jgi:transcriptional regulator with XRE-family HTH domain